jgi:hypothetical protein
MPELADIISRHGAAYCAKFADRMPPSHLRAIEDIEQCRTPALGGSVYGCPEHPEQLRYSYHSCNNRSCPKCGNNRATQWIEKQRALLLAVDYFLVTYTLPQECRSVARSNQRGVYNALFRASATTFRELAACPKHLGGTVGMMGILQTWRRDIGYHPHIHYVVPGGALAPDGRSWRPHRYRRWLVPERALAARFRDRFRLELQRLGLLDQVDPAVWQRDRKWVVDCQPVGTGEHSLKYLATYVHRTALTNGRIKRLGDDGTVTFAWKHRHSGRSRHMTLPAQQFIARFLQHVLPSGFVRVRYYGFLSPGVRKEALARIRALLAPGRGLLAKLPDPPPQPQDDRSIATAPHCPLCGRAMLLVQIIPRGGRGHLPQQRGPP